MDKKEVTILNKVDPVILSVAVLNIVASLAGFDDNRIMQSGYYC